jgi:hypothetical protein
MRLSGLTVEEINFCLIRLQPMVHCHFPQLRYGVFEFTGYNRMIIGFNILFRAVQSVCDVYDCSLRDCITGIASWAEETTSSSDFFMAACRSECNTGLLGPCTAERINCHYLSAFLTLKFVLVKERECL